MTYACPYSESEPEVRRDAVVCGSVEYPNRGGFYDFLGDDRTENDALVSLFDTVAGVYETPVWYPTGMRIATGGRASVENLVENVAERVEGFGAEKVLDVATGTGLFARRLARDANVYGVDASAEMLRRAFRKARRKGIVLELARADAAALPYADDSFDAATCCGALHLLPRPRDALGEMGRVVRPDGRLVVTTLVDEGFFAPRSVQAASRLYGMRVFDDLELDTMLNLSGFERAESETRRDSSLVTLVARRR